MCIKAMELKTVFFKLNKCQLCKDFSVACSRYELI